MHGRRSLLCGLVLLLLIPLMIQARRALPRDARPLVAEKYAGWCGVLRLWVYEGWETGAGGVAGWLNAQITRFEKRHPGVYVQPQYVEADTLSGFVDSGLVPPDLMLFPPGVLTAPVGLLPLDEPVALRPTLTGTGGGYAVPVLTGGYLWVENAALDGGACLVPEPERFRRWDAATLALLAVETFPDAPAPTVDWDAGVDLGLPALSPANGASVRFTADAWRAFINGESFGMPVTQRELRRLEALSAQGRGPDWRVVPGGGAFTDQLLFMAVVAKPDAQAELCRALIALLLDDDSQGSLHRCGAFSVTASASGYGPGDGLLAMEAALRRDDLVAARCFGGGGPEAFEGIVRKLEGEVGDTVKLWQQIAEQLREHPND